MTGEEGHETATKYPALVRINSVSHTADIHLLKQIAASDSNAASEAGRELRHESQPETARSGKEQHAASLIVNQLANSERDIVRQPDAGERGRMPEHDEQTLSRTIQKER